MERTEIRIVAGRLRGRKLICQVHPGMRPTPQMVREAFFSILGNAIPDRPFYDIFSGTGAVGLEALSRGASRTIFVERDFALAGAIEKHLERFGVADGGQLMKTDAYRWAERWIAPNEPVNLFLSPPFPDLKNRLPEFIQLVELLLSKAADKSVLVIQAEEGFDLVALPVIAWDIRKYGRNLLLIAVKDDPPEDGGAP
jgi:16S rRNA (guanine966-N2)-methyltransferase